MANVNVIKRFGIEKKSKWGFVHYVTANTRKVCLSCNLFSKRQLGHSIQSIGPRPQLCPFLLGHIAFINPSVSGMASKEMFEMRTSSRSSTEEPGGGCEMAAGIMSVLKPSVELLDAQILETRQSQESLGMRIQELADLLHDMSEEAPFDLDEYVRKIDNSQTRITNAAKALENLHDRLSKLQRNIARDAHAKKQVITAPTPAPPRR